MWEAEQDRTLHRILADRRLQPVPDPAPGGRRWGPVLVGAVVVAVLAAVAVVVLPDRAGPVTAPAAPPPVAPR